MRYIPYVNPNCCTDWKWYEIKFDNDWRALSRKIEIGGKIYEMIIDIDSNEPFRHVFSNAQLKWFRKRNKIIK